MHNVHGFTLLCGLCYPHQYVKYLDDINVYFRDQVFIIYRYNVQ